MLEIIESEIEQNKELKAMPLDKNRNSFIVEGNQLVSMNMFAFTKDIFKFLKEEFVNFYNRSDHEKGENEFKLSKKSCCQLWGDSKFTLWNSKIHL